VLASVVLLSACAGCSRGGGEGAAKPAAPVVRDDSTDLSFFWFDSTGAVHRVARISDVPLVARDRVLIQPLDPQKATGAWAFVADLRRAGADGAFPVQVLAREAYSNEVRARMAAGRPAATTASTGTVPAGGTDSTQAKAPPSPPLPTADKRVVIYVTQACPYCRRAREWMTKVGIPFVEHDIEQDAAAARWVMQNTGSTAVPVFQIGSRVLQGFNPDALRRAVQEELGIQLL
jgi:glutaredoxin